MTHRMLTRRSMVLGSAGAVLIADVWTPGMASAKSGLMLTPSQTEGPFYPVSIPQDNDGDLLRNGAEQYTKGQVAWIKGGVTDPDGKPVSDAIVEIWQCDHDGHYHHPNDGNQADRSFQGFGRVKVDRDGLYTFRTMRPEPYSGRTPHIHVKVKRGSRTLLTTQFYMEGHPDNARDSIWRRLNARERAALTRPFVAKPDGFHADFPIVLNV